MLRPKQKKFFHTEPLCSLGKLKPNREPLCFLTQSLTNEAVYLSTSQEKFIPPLQLKNK